jgi:CRP/FNR family cyclic AMP-dependent transcriptional regulator
MKTALPEIAALLERAARKRFAAGDLIVGAAGESGALYCVVSGAVTVEVDAQQTGWLIVADLGPGEFFGEFAPVRARDECEIAVVTRQDFQASIEQCPALLLHLTGQAARRLRAVKLHHRQREVR